MTKPRTYTLELTAEEALLLATHSDVVIGHELRPKLFALREQARADATADELRLPWRVGRLFGHPTFEARVEPGDAMVPTYSERQLKLMSAAPELLEAVQAARAYWAPPPTETGRYATEVQPLIDRALRKVETGVPE